ncbi:hypothetical protein F4808DRAFT_460031 [Astrocystis sublimbata]|nr:hypothetical protein F4808DRAFT_460031 [Astrocystis sublimbata]
MRPSQSQNIGSTSTHQGHSEAQVPNTGQIHEDDASTLMDEQVDPGPSTQRCWSSFQVDSHNTSVVYESWEMISVQPTTELTSFRSILGVKLYSRYRVLKDRYTGVRAIPNYSQEELAQMVATAEGECSGKNRILNCFKRKESYSQNVAKRIFELPACLPSKLGALLDCRFVATNKNPCVRRDWKVVMLKPVVGFMTDEESNGGLGKDTTRDPVQKWLIILRGQDTRLSETGFAAFNTMSNPWAKIDEGLQGHGR